jgi:hypothetical protein
MCLGGLFVLLPPRDCAWSRAKRMLSRFPGRKSFETGSRIFVNGAVRCRPVRKHSGLSPSPNYIEFLHYDLLSAVLSQRLSPRRRENAELADRLIASGALKMRRLCWNQVPQNVR